MIEFTVTVQEVKDVGVSIKIDGEAYGDSFSTAEADVADVLTDVIRDTPLPKYKESVILQDQHIRQGK